MDTAHERGGAPAVALPVARRNLRALQGGRGGALGSAGHGRGLLALGLQEGHRHRRPSPTWASPASTPCRSGPTTSASR